MQDLQDAAERFVDWLQDRVLSSARGEQAQRLDVDPSGKFWLGRLAPEEAVRSSRHGDRGERLAPCALGIRFRPRSEGELQFVVTVRAVVWRRESPGDWRKSPAVEERIPVVLGRSEDGYEQSFGEMQLREALSRATGLEFHRAEVRVEILALPGERQEVVVMFVNITPEDAPQSEDANLYECSLRIDEVEFEPYLLEALPDSFRYDRRVPAFGINCGIKSPVHGIFETDDVAAADRYRPSYWAVSAPEPDLSFDTLYRTPVPVLRALHKALAEWGAHVWNGAQMGDRAEKESWSSEMLHEAEVEAGKFQSEVQRIAEGVALLESDATLAKAFSLANRAMGIAARGRYTGWRPFQVGFLLANLSCICTPDGQNDVADVVWFATGGGKTETYLGLIVTAALYDRLTGKTAGVTAWSRFPLRMLSLQQTQRFADAMAAAEVVRREAGIKGDPFSVGFLVGQNATPNRIKADAKGFEPNPDDEDMPRSYQVLLRCPFCHGDEILMEFDRRRWTLDHVCRNPKCTWPGHALPFYVVDEEIFRFLPTVVIGTLDKAALIGMQGAMRGLVGPPVGRCPLEGHGYTWSPRSTRPGGCLVPGCKASPVEPDQAPDRFAPSFRLQDELHLLRDSLGAVDAHYEALYDHLQEQLCGRRQKILASSATLTGYERQVQVLYRRSARVFPLAGPSSGEGFWSSDSGRLMRRYIALAPRGVTLEYAIDRSLTDLQNAIRDFRREPNPICEHYGIDPAHAEELISLYGTDVVYGNTLRDLDAVMRSLETQIRLSDGGTVNTAALTGRTSFDEVRQTLARLEVPEGEFKDRLHVVTASSMMSHGVDIDRLNVMLMLGVPLGTAEFIQATARVGRRWPGLVFVVHKMARERDAGVYRSFKKFVEQGDRFVEPIPVTRRSRRVLQRTIAGMELARILAIHEPLSGRALTTVRALREYLSAGGLDENKETEALVQTLGLHEPIDAPLRSDLKEWIQDFFANLRDPGGTFKWPSDLSPTGSPMLSLRDVEEQVAIFGRTLT